MATSTSDTAFLTTRKSFTYRDQREEWVNVYHLDSTPANSQEWSDLVGAAWPLEAVCFPIDVQLEGATGHEAGTPPRLVFEMDAPPEGEGGYSGTWIPAAQQTQAPGDAASWVRWGTDLKNSRGKPIYFRNYFHGMYITGNGDVIAPTQHDALLALGLAWQNGLSASGRTYRRTGPNGGSPQSHAVSQYITTRTLKRRGKRKKIPQTFEIMGGPTGTDFFKWFVGKLPGLIP